MTFLALTAFYFYSLRDEKIPRNIKILGVSGELQTVTGKHGTNVVSHSGKLKSESICTRTSARWRHEFTNSSDGHFL